MTTCAGKCGESDKRLRMQQLDILVNVRTAVVTEANAEAILNFQDLAVCHQVVKDNSVQAFCKHRTGSIGCRI
jgi:hypothetical protein